MHGWSVPAKSITIDACTGPRQNDTAVSQLTLLDAEEEERDREEEKLTISSLGWWEDAKRR